MNPDRFPRWWMRYGVWLGPAAVLASGANTLILSYVPPFGWGSVLQRIGGWGLLGLAAVMLLSSADLLAREREAGRTRLVEFREGTDAYEELRAAELATASVEQVTVRRSALALVLSGYGAMRAVLAAQVSLDRQQRTDRASDG